MQRNSLRYFFLWGMLLAILAIIAGPAVWFRMTANSVASSNINTQESDTFLERLSVYGQVPDFSLIERSERPVQLADLLGKVWIVNFAYTRCTETCPVQTANMAKLQQAFAGEPDVRLVTISVDPESDTPEFLREYASRYSADPDRWLFLTGSKEVIYQLAIDGFRLGVVEKPLEEPHIHPDGTVHIHKTAAGERVIHSSRFVLVDRQARIRAYFRGAEYESVERLRPAAMTVLQEK